jgi:predicted Rossmann-fold nucleotide-binding protein
MSGVSRAFFEIPDRAGVVIGVLPADRFPGGEPPKGYPNPWVEIPIRTHLHLSGAQGTALGSRNHINILSSDVIVAFPGSWGTRSEVTLALRYRKPVAAYLQERTEIPQLPPSVPVLAHLEQVQAFVRRALGRAP